MTNFVKNLNAYLEFSKIKKTYLSSITGIEISKLNRILSGNQEINASDMHVISKVFGVNESFFFSENLKFEDQRVNNELAFYAGTPTKKQEEIANLLKEYFDNIDTILSFEIRLQNVE